MEDYQNSFEFRQVELLIRFNHPCIVSIAGWDIQDGFLEVGTEWHENESLDKILENRYQNKGTPKWFNSTAVAILIAGIVIGMRFLHHHNILHWNFTPASVLIDRLGRPQIGDFSMSLCEVTSIDLNHPPQFLMPKLIERGEFGLAFDVFTFGLLLFEMLGGSQVFTGSRQLISNEIRSGKRPALPGNLPEVSRKLIEDCWHRDPTKRPTFENIFARLRGADFKVLNDVNVTQVNAYVTETENLERVCLSAGFAPPLPLKEPPFNPKFWQMDFSQFGRTLFAKGSAAEVFRATDTERHEILAVKRTKRSLLQADLDDLLHSRTFREVLCHIRFNHPCILSMIGWNIPEDNHLEIGTDFFENGPLDIILEERRNAKRPIDRLNPTAVAIIIAGMAFGLRHIHSRGAIHRDLKPANVLIDERGRAQIGDLGLCRSEGLDWTANVGTPAYSSPEVLKEGEYGPPLDVFAFGLIVYELIVGPKVFTGTFTQVTTAICDGIRPKIPGDVPAVSRDLITRCWDVNPSERPSFQDIIDDLKGANFQVLPNVDTTQVSAYVTEIEQIERQCYRTPIVLPHFPDKTPGTGKK